MAHQPTLSALRAATYWLEAHPDLPTPVLTVDTQFKTFAPVTFAWHFTGDMGTHEDALIVLRAVADWPWRVQHPTHSLTTYKLEHEGVALVIYTDAIATPTTRVNLLDALAEVA